MEKRVIITSIQIKTANKTKVLDKNEIKKFCRERVQISVKEIISDAHLNGGSTKNEQQQLKVKDISKTNHAVKCKKNLQLATKKLMPSAGTFCFAKVRGFSEWPAVVTSTKKPNHVWVKFFNSAEIACLPLEKIFTLEEGTRFLKKYKERKTGFVKAVKELSVALEHIEPKHRNQNKLVHDVLQIYKTY